MHENNTPSSTLSKANLLHTAIKSLFVHKCFYFDTYNKSQYYLLAKFCNLTLSKNFSKLSWNILAIIFLTWFHWRRQYSF